MSVPLYPVYVPHEFTLLVAGSTLPRKAASCALHHIMDGHSPVEFLSLGANAGQQCAKAMASLLGFYNSSNEDLNRCIGFQPIWYLVSIPEVGVPETEDSLKACLVWRVVLFDASQVQLTKETLNG